MNYTEIQSELLTETRTPAQVLQYALNKERGQENQRAIAGRLRATNIMDNQIAHIDHNQYPQQRRTQPQNIRNTTNQQRRPQQQRNQGTYRFINGFYGLSDMPAIFQKTIDKTLENIPNKFNFLDDILIITKGTIVDHISDIKLILKRLDEENLAIKQKKCEFAKQNITWLGYNITQSGISPNDKKTDSIKSLEPPKTLRQLRSLMDQSIN